jgi:hypothetical protein
MPFQAAGRVAVAAATKSDWTASKPSASGHDRTLRPQVQFSTERPLAELAVKSPDDGSHGMEGHRPQAPQGRALAVPRVGW